MTLNSSIVRLQDVYRVFSGVGGNIVGGHLTWDFVNKRLKDIRTALVHFVTCVKNFVYTLLEEAFQLIGCVGNAFKRASTI